MSTAPQFDLLNRRKNEMQDVRLVAARILVWDEERCRREPAHRAFIIRTLEGMQTDEELPPETAAEVAMLIRKLRAHGLG